MVVVPTTHIICTLAINILHKVMLYPADDMDSPSKTKYILVDYLRPTLALSAEDIVVPIYPEIGDMLKVCGSSSEVWYAHVRTVDNHSKTCKINFYVEDVNCPGKYRRETLSHRNIEILHWDSILDLATGYWSDNFWFSSS